MRFQLIGVNHKTAPVEVRERLAIPESRLAEACKRLSEHPSVAEGMIVSTCNRVEFIANMKNGTGDLREFLREYFETDLSPFESHLYEFREDEAIRHIFRVAASLDSMVVGEPQILGQVKEAYATARAVGAVGRSSISCLPGRLLWPSASAPRPPSDLLPSRLLRWPSNWRRKYLAACTARVSIWSEQGRCAN